MGSKPQNAMLAKLEAKIRAELEKEFRVRLAVFQQQMEEAFKRRTEAQYRLDLDVAIVTANRVLGMGPGRCGQFVEVYDETARSMTGLIDEDSQDDKELAWSMAVRDRTLEPIMGEHFIPASEWYGK